jgi:hypothetical protein
MVLNAALLRREMTKKGLDGKALSTAAKVSPGVITGALKGNPVRLKSGTQIVHAIRSAPDVEGMDDYWPDKKTTAVETSAGVDEEEQEDARPSTQA